MSTVYRDHTGRRVGFATPAEARARLLAIARGEAVCAPDEPKLWLAPGCKDIPGAIKRYEEWCRKGGEETE